MRKSNIFFIILCIFSFIRWFLQKDIKVTTVPHLKGLRTVDLIEFIAEKLDSSEYLPDNYVDQPPNRTWIGNICVHRIVYFNIGNTLNQQLFKQFIHQKLSEREKEFIKAQNLWTEVDEHIANVFNTSQMMACKSWINNIFISQKR